MTDYHKTDVEGLVKDPNSGAVLSVDNKKLDAYRKQKQMFSQATSNFERINKVENDLNEIKNLLKQLLEK